MPGKWEFPGGKIEEGETPEAALEREIYEEFGVEVQTKEFLHANLYDYGSFKIELRAYKTLYKRGDFELTDHDRIEWVRPEILESYDLTEADLPIIPFIVMDEY
jgi:8-oxo-dGTP diphosphatase